jgi:plastocyanin
MQFDNIMTKPNLVFMIAVIVLCTVTNISIPSSAQNADTAQISIVSGASSLTDTAYQPNPANIGVGDSIMWTNDYSASHTVTAMDQQLTNSSESINDSDSGIVEIIIDEIVSNIVINVRNILEDETENNNTLAQSTSPSSYSFDSGVMLQGETFMHTFDSPGTFEYYCTVHPAMVAQVVVSQ